MQGWFVGRSRVGSVCLCYCEAGRGVWCWEGDLVASSIFMGNGEGGRRRCWVSMLALRII